MSRVDPMIMQIVHVLFCCVLLQLGIYWFYSYPSGLLCWHWGNHMINLPKFFRNTLLALGQSYDCPSGQSYDCPSGQSYDCPSANKGTLKNMNPKSTDNTATTKQNKIKQYNTKPHAYSVGCSVLISKTEVFPGFKQALNYKNAS